MGAVQGDRVGRLRAGHWITDGRRRATRPTPRACSRRAAELLELLQGFYRGAAAAAGDGVVVAAV